MDQQKQKVRLKKKEKDFIEGKTRSIQDQLNTLNKKIKSRRSKLLKIKDAQAKVEEIKRMEIQDLNQKVRKNQLRIKEQMFFIQNLIPKSFIRSLNSSQSEKENSDQNFRPLAGVSIHNLRKPLSIHDYDIRDSYLCPYNGDFGMKRGKIAYPDFEDILCDGRPFILV